MTGIEKLLAVPSGDEAETVAWRFFQRALQTLIRAVLHHQDISHNDRDDFAVALMLIVTMQQPDARKALGLKRRPRGASLSDPAAYDWRSPEMTVARDYLEARIDEKQALDALATHLENSNRLPENEKTLRALLNRLIEKENAALDLIEALYLLEEKQEKIAAGLRALLEAMYDHPYLFDASPMSTK